MVKYLEGEKHPVGPCSTGEQPEACVFGSEIPK